MTPIASLITSFLREHLPVVKGASPHTTEAYATTFRLLFEFASCQLRIRPAQLTLEQIDLPLVAKFLEHIEVFRGPAARQRDPATHAEPLGCEEKAARSDAFRCGRRRHATCVPGWRSAAPCRSRSSSSTPQGAP